MKTQLTPDILYNRHRLSYPQIDSLLGTNHKELYQKDIIENFKVIREFIVVTDEFRKMDIRFITLKGPLLSQRIYRNATYRRYRDLDILIDLKDIPLVYRYLITMGYCPEYKLPEDEKGRQFLYNYMKHIPFIHPKTKVIFEIHWQILELKDLFETNFNYIYQHISINYVYMNKNFQILNKEYDLIYLLIHGSMHRWQRLKWLVDIKDYMLSTSFDWLEINKLAQKYKASGVIPLYNSIATIYLPDSPTICIDLKIPAFLVKICVTYIESDEMILSANNMFESITNSFKKILYELILFPIFLNRVNLLKKKLIRYLDSEEIKSTNSILLILYRPFGYFYRCRGGN